MPLDTQKALQTAAAAALLVTGVSLGTLLPKSRTEPLEKPSKLVQGRIFSADGVPTGSAQVLIHSAGREIGQAKVDANGYYAVTFTEPMIELQPKAAGTRFEPVFVQETTRLDFRGVSVK
jgi:hypothetical protein